MLWPGGPGSNSETPLLIWNNGIRAELADFVQSRQEAALKGEAMPENLVGDFAYSDIKPEVCFIARYGRRE